MGKKLRYAANYGVIIATKEFKFSMEEFSLPNSGMLNMCIGQLDNTSTPTDVNTPVLSPYMASQLLISNYLSSSKLTEMLQH